MIRNEKGFTLLDMLFVCGLIGIISVIAMPRLLLARQSANAASAIATMRAINSAQLTFALTCGAGFYAPDLTTLGVMPPGSNEGFIAPGLTSANTVTKSGYIMQLSGTPFVNAPVSCNGLAAGAAARAFKAAADPVVPSNARFFATNSNASIYEHTSTLFVLMPEVGSPAAGHPLD